MEAARQYRLEDLPLDAQRRVAEARAMVGQIHTAFLLYDPNLRPMVDPMCVLLVSLVTRAEYAESRIEALEGQA